MSIFENMNAREIAMCLSAFYYAAKKYTHAQLYGTQVHLPNREKPINMDSPDYDEGIKILRDDYDVFWTPDTKPDDLKWKINKRRMMLSGATHWELETYDRFVRKYIDTDSVLGRVTFGPGCVVTGNDYLYRRELGLPDNATVADICKKIRRLMDESCVLNSKVLKLEDADRLRRHWHSKYEKEHEECVRLSKLHVADKEKKDKQDATIRDLSNQNTTLEYSVAALKKRIRSMEAEAAEKETKNKVITDTLRDNLVDSVEECKKLNGRIRELKSERDSLYTWKNRHRLIENSWYGMLSTPGCAVDNNYAYRRVLGLPDNAPVADILDRIKELKDENSELAQELKTVEQDKQKLKEAVEDISRDRGNIERLRKHWHSKYEKEHEECVRLSKLHAADKEKETKTKVITDTLRDNLVDSIEECKRLNAKIKDLERTIRTLNDEEDE